MGKKKNTKLLLSTKEKCVCTNSGDRTNMQKQAKHKITSEYTEAYVNQPNSLRNVRRVEKGRQKVLPE